MSTSAQEAKARKLNLLKSQGKLKYPTRAFNRCNLSGRSRSYMRFFGLSRNQFRDLAMKGEIPGVRKASW